MKHNIPLKRIRDFNPSDLLSLIPMLCALVSLPVTRRRYIRDWLVCDRASGEHDNGYHFFKYLRTNHPEQDCTFYISKNSPNYEEVSNLGKTAQYGGISHWIAFFCSEYVISSQSGRPNEHMCTLFERLGLFSPPRVFLQHGVTKDRPPYLMADKLYVRFFITTTPQEYSDVKKEFGHPAESVILTGFPRFDALHDLPSNPRTLLIMPTWRKWLSERSERVTGEQGLSLLRTYIDSWDRLLSDERIHRIEKENGLEIVLFLHNNMKDILDIKSLSQNGIRFAKKGDDLQEYMKNSVALITDYSSVFFDFAYMKKPSIFYQFDEEMYRRLHYPQGWFDYHETAFGSVCKDVDMVVASLEDLQSSDFKPSVSFLSEHLDTFTLYDNQNSKRLFDVLKDHR